jgi:hypothetical protein
LSADAFGGGCASEDEDDEGAPVLGDLADLAADPALTSEEGSSSFDAQRALCPDGACVGVLGPHGRCKVCGQVAER